MTSCSTIRHFPQITTVFDSGGDHPHSLLYSGSIRTALLRLLPSDFFFAERDDSLVSDFLEEFDQMLPIFKWNEWGEGPYNISLFLLTKHRHNAVKFFYEMISRWLVPGRRLNFSSFLATDFQLSDTESGLYTISEVVISFETMLELELVRRYLPVIESEIKLGLVSVYHASRILEIKGLSADEKTSLIQERISSLLERRPRDFDYDIFTQMQHFLVMCGEEFKAARSYGHMSRIIYVFYLFRKTLRSQLEKHASQRYVSVKLSKVQLQFPLGLKKALGVFVGLNLLNDNEMFEQRHLMRVLNVHFPYLDYIDESYFVTSVKEEKMQLLYLEVEKSDGTDFSLQEIKWLREKLPSEVKDGIEKLMRPIFMPRNEEEVMRNIITLSQQLRYPRDLPQVIIAFEEQTELELSFTIILLRILNDTFTPLHKLFHQAQTVLKFVPDRIKKVGMVRKKYPKEAAVFYVRIPAIDFLRPDHSVDLFKARQEVLAELQRIVGEMRDFNGGMIAKQHEQFLATKACFPSMERKEERLLENVFHSIFPIELRSVVEPLSIKTLFNMLLKLMEKKEEGWMVKTESDVIFFLLSYRDPTVKEQIVNGVEQLYLSSSQLVTVSLQIFEAFYLGYIYRDRDKDKQEGFLTILQSCKAHHFPCPLAD